VPDHKNIVLFMEHLSSDILSRGPLNSVGDFQYGMGGEELRNLGIKGWMIRLGSGSNAGSQARRKSSGIDAFLTRVGIYG
jgi:hypothetical protein